MVLNYPLIAKITSAILVLLGVSMVPSMLVSVIYGETSSVEAFLKCIIPLIFMGLLFMKKIHPRSTALRTRDGFLIVALCWFLASILGGLPFLLTDSISTFSGAFFETASGFTTTGSTIIADVEVLPKGILFWRSFTHWLGGMGILVFFIALLPSLGISGQSIINAETTGPIKDKLTPKISDSAKLLYTIYIGMTVLEVVLLVLGGVSLFDALIHTFGSVGTGGLSNYNDSVGHFNSAYVDIVIGVFMMLSGVNFNLYYHLLSGKPREFFSDFELRGYMVILGGATLLIALNLLTTGMYSTVGDALRFSFFQSSSIITTTGFTTTDFDLWPTFSKMVLFLLMFVGGCSSSTGGGIKVIRILLLFKLVRREMYHRLHPRAVLPLKLRGKSLPMDVISGVSSFVFLYLAIMLIGTLLLSLENLDITSTFTAVIASIGNIGPGFGLVGPTMNYGLFSAPAKVLLSILMIIGRLELFTVVLLAAPTFWNPDKQYK